MRCARQGVCAGADYESILAHTAVVMAPSVFEIVLIGFILILPFLYETSKRFRYYLKFFLYYSYVMAAAVLVIPIMACKPKDVRNLLIASRICKYVSNILGMKWEIRGTEILAQDRACVIVANHQSSLDILGMFDMWPSMDKCTVVAKKELFYAWPFGLAAWLCGLIFIDRMNAEKARASINDSVSHLVDNKIKLWVFPEGTRRNTGEIHPFKKGAFHVAVNAQIPILPVVFSRYYFLNTMEKSLDIGKVIITVLPTIETHGLKPGDVESLMSKTKELMFDTFKASSREVQENLLGPLVSC